MFPISQTPEIPEARPETPTPGSTAPLIPSTAQLLPSSTWKMIAIKYFLAFLAQASPLIPLVLYPYKSFPKSCDLNPADESDLTTIFDIRLALALSCFFIPPGVTALLNYPRRSVRTVVPSPDEEGGRDLEGAPEEEKGRKPWEALGPEEESETSREHAPAPVVTPTTPDSPIAPTTPPDSPIAPTTPPDSPRMQFYKAHGLGPLKFICGIAGFCAVLRYLAPLLSSNDWLQGTTGVFGFTLPVTLIQWHATPRLQPVLTATALAIAEAIPYAVLLLQAASTQSHEALLMASFHTWLFTNVGLLVPALALYILHAWNKDKVTQETKMLVLRTIAISLFSKFAPHFFWTLPGPCAFMVAIGVGFEALAGNSIFELWLGKLLNNVTEKINSRLTGCGLFKCCRAKPTVPPTSTSPEIRTPMSPHSGGGVGA